MSAAGDYWQKFLILRQQSSKEEMYGEDEESHPDLYAVEAWGFTEELKVAEQVMYGGMVGLSEVRVHLRGYHDVTELDRLRNKATEETYHVVGVSYGDNEVICKALRVSNNA